jgi:hypothetical protein
MIFFKKKLKETKEDVFGGKIVWILWEHILWHVFLLAVLIILFFFILSHLGIFLAMTYIITLGVKYVFVILFIGYTIERLWRKSVILTWKELDGLTMYSSKFGTKKISTEWGVHIFEGINFFVFTIGSEKYTIWFSEFEKKQFKRFLKEKNIKMEVRKGFSFLLPDV